MTLDDDQLTCEACERTAGDSEFRAHAAREVDDCICDECLTVQRDAADADHAGARAWYGG